jgi:hypothetical protein
MKKELPGNCSGPWPSDCFDSLFAPAASIRDARRKRSSPAPTAALPQVPIPINPMVKCTIYRTFKRAFVIVGYLYLKKIALSRQFSSIFYNLLKLLINLRIIICVIFLNGDYT